MPLEQSKIIANAKKYFETATNNGFMNDELITFLGEDFIKAPANNMASYNNAFEGGLIDHLLKVASYAIKVNNILSDDEKVDQKSLLKVCLLHGIGKAKLYKPCMSEWHRTNQGKYYDYNDKITPMRVGERSVYYALSNGIELTEEEYTAIIFFDKVEDKMADYHNTMLGELLKIGISLAIKNEKNNKK